MTKFNPVLQQSLCDAVAASDAVAAQRALDAGASVDWPPKEGAAPPLVVAARRGDSAMVEWLLEHRAFALACQGNNAPEFALSVALERGDTAIARSIFARVGAFDGSLFGAAAAALAAGPHDDAPMLAELLAACDDAHRPGPSDLGPAIAASATMGHAQLVDALLVLGAQPDSVSPAALGGWPEIVRRLAASGASVNRVAPDSCETPLHAAVRAPRDAAATATALLRLECRENGRDRDGRTPSELAVALGREELATLITSLAPQCGPRWMRDARTRRIERYVFLITRAHGLGFDPHDIEKPILWEGDYVGFGHAFSAQEALVRWQTDFAPHAPVRDATRWFVPFMEKLAAREDFGLDELEKAAPEARCVADRSGLSRRPG